MRAEGMSTRAIASGLGVDNATVHRDLARVADATPDAAAAQPITGQDGKTYRQAAVGGGE
jgi:IS30 family transposase